jgi:hypothetical protein
MKTYYNLYSNKNKLIVGDYQVNTNNLADDLIDCLKHYDKYLYSLELLNDGSCNRFYIAFEAGEMFIADVVN